MPSERTAAIGRSHDHAMAGARLADSVPCSSHSKASTPVDFTHFGTVSNIRLPVCTEQFVLQNHSPSSRKPLTSLFPGSRISIAKRTIYYWNRGLHARTCGRTSSHCVIAGATSPCCPASPDISAVVRECTGAPLDVATLRFAIGGVYRGAGAAGAVDTVSCSIAWPGVL